jgi:hypothetical protein
VIGDAASGELGRIIAYKQAWVRHEALGDRTEVRDLRRVAVAAAA